MTQSNLAQPLVYIIELILAGQPRSLAVIPVDAANGVILDAPEGSDFYEGKSLSGSNFKILIAAVTNVFATWWKSEQRTNQGKDTWHLSEEAIEDTVESAQNRPECWNEHGALINPTSGKEITGDDDIEPTKRRIW